jgi:hypothetical protein
MSAQLYLWHSGIDVESDEADEGSDEDRRLMLGEGGVIF